LQNRWLFLHRANTLVSANLKNRYPVLPFKPVKMAPF